MVGAADAVKHVPAQRVAVCLYPDATGPASALLPMRLEPSTGSWSAQRPGSLAGQYYTSGTQAKSLQRALGVVEQLADFGRKG